MAGRLIDDLTKGADTTVVTSHGQVLAQHIEALCREVDAGRIAVDSMAMLRVVRDVTCKDIISQLAFPNGNKERVVRELRLLVNTVRHVLLSHDS